MNSLNDIHLGSVMSVFQSIKWVIERGTIFITESYSVLCPGTKFINIVIIVNIVSEYTVRGKVDPHFLNSLVKITLFFAIFSSPPAAYFRLIDQTKKIHDILTGEKEFFHDWGLARVPMILKNWKLNTISHDLVLSLVLFLAC